MGTRRAATDEPDAVLDVDGREVVVTHPSKVLIPAAGVTKLDLARYHVAVAEGALRGAGGRPCVLVRYPDGTEGDFFFQKRAPAARPDWVEVATIRFPSGRTADEIVPRHAADLAWMANLACLEFHPHPVRADDLEHPDELRIDLDPVPGVAWPQIRAVAHVVREALDAVGLVGWPKTSGSRGLHVLVRIDRRWGFDAVRRAALALARDVERRVPDLATSAWWKEERHGVFLDYNQNAKDRTVASAYSVRPKPDARVSMPIAWDELDACDPADFTLRTVPARLAERGDPHAGIDAAPGSLDALLELSARHEADGHGDAPWPPHYRKGLDEPRRAPPSTARGARARTPAAAAAATTAPTAPTSPSAPGAKRARAPLIEIARGDREEEAIAVAEAWKAAHPALAAHLEPADTLVDRLLGASSVTWRVQLNLTRVPAPLRPRASATKPKAS